LPLTAASSRPQKTIAAPGKGILAIDESNATCGKRLDSIGEHSAQSFAQRNARASSSSGRTLARC
jgi:fructose-bisphosphate aldolase class 1